MQQHSNIPFQFVLAHHHLQGKNEGTDTKYPFHSSLPFLDAPLLSPDLQRKHAYSPVDNVHICSSTPSLCEKVKLSLYITWWHIAGVGEWMYMCTHS
jgi:hypothetical protein